MYIYIIICFIETENIKLYFKSNKEISGINFFQLLKVDSILKDFLCYMLCTNQNTNFMIVWMYVEVRKMPAKCWHSQMLQQWILSDFTTKYLLFVYTIIHKDDTIPCHKLLITYCYQFLFSVWVLDWIIVVSLS